MSHITNIDGLIPGLRVHVLMVGGFIKASRIRAVRIFRDNEYPEDCPESTLGRGRAMVFWEPNDNGGKPNTLAHQTNHGDWYSYLASVGISHDTERFKTSSINGVFHTHEEALEYAMTDEYSKAVGHHEATCNEAIDFHDDPFGWDAYVDGIADSDETTDTDIITDWEDHDHHDDLDPDPPAIQACHSSNPAERDPEAVETYQRTIGGSTNLGDILADALDRQTANNENPGDNRP